MNSRIESRNFAVLNSDRVDEGFQVLIRAGEWLRSKGRRQRITKTSFETYLRWQEDGDNYAVMESGRIIAVATLRLEVLSDWPDHMELGPCLMLRGLATDPDYRGSRAGAFAIDGIKSLRPVDGDVYLDCVSDFLPEYYGRHGFEVVARRMIAHDDEAPYDCSLMVFRRR